MANYVYQPLCSVTVGDTDIEIAEDKNAKPGKRYCVYEREGMGLIEEFHRMEYTDDFSEAVKVFSDMVQDQVNAYQATVRQTATGEFRSNNPLRVNFYCPLTVQTEDDEYDLALHYDPELIELDSSILIPHEEQIRAALVEEMARGDGADMATYYNGKAKDKLISAKWDVEAVSDKLYGVIHIELTEPLTEEEKADLASWLSGQNSDGLLENFSEEPFNTEDGNLHVGFWNDSDDYFVLDDEEFEQHLSGGQQMGGYE